MHGSSKTRILAKSLSIRILTILAVLMLLLPLSGGAVAAATLFSATFDAGYDGFSYQDDAFGTSQPNYASGTRVATGGYGGTGGLQVTLGGVDANAITGMSGGFAVTLNLAAAETGVKVSFRYKLDQTATYEFDEYTRMLVKVDGVQYGRGAKNYVDHIGGDGSSTQGNSNTFLPTTDWQQHEVFVGNLAAGNHTILLGGYNNKKDAADESTTATIDDVIVTSGNAAPVASGPQTVVSRLSFTQYKSDLQSVASFGDRCHMSGCSTTSYYNALAWTETQLQALGYTTVRHEYTSGSYTGTNLYATKVGTGRPDQMYMITAMFDGRGGGQAADDNASGVSLAMQAARMLAGADVQTDKSVRFIFFDQEESGLIGSAAYVSGRRTLQGIETPAGSGKYPEPTWLGLVNHDMVLYDHGAGTAGASQSAYADLDVEWRAGTTKEADSKALALKWAFATGTYATDYPATAYNYSTNTDDTSFHPYVASVSVRENRRSLTSGTNAEWINPNYHTSNDRYSSYSDADFRLGFNATQVTLGIVAELAGADIGTSNQAPVANAQSVTTAEDTAKAITLTGSDPDGNPLTYSVVTQPGHGSLSGTAPNTDLHPGGQLQRCGQLHLQGQRRQRRLGARHGVGHRHPRQRRAGGERTGGDDQRGYRQGHHPDRFGCGRQPADLQRGDAARPRQPERDRTQPDLHPGGQLQRCGQLHLQGERRGGRFGPGHGDHHGHPGQRRAGRERAVGDDQRGHREGHHPERLGCGRQPADLQRGDAARPRQPERDRAQPDLHPGRQLQRRGQLHLQGQ